MNQHLNSGKARRAIRALFSENHALEAGLVQALVRLRGWSTEDAAVLYAQIRPVMTKEAKAAFEQTPPVLRIRWRWGKLAWLR